ncbi:hypothetical protein D3C76_1721740 [compost metagenome]
MEPSRLPAQVCGRMRSRSAMAILPVFTPKVRNMVWPVNSSEPAMTTKVRAMPKVAPITSGRTLASTRLPRVKMRMMPRPT